MYLLFWHSVNLVGLSCIFIEMWTLGETIERTRVDCPGNQDATFVGANANVIFEVSASIKYRT